jgi:hypothetical protein
MHSSLFPQQPEKRESENGAKQDWDMLQKHDRYTVFTIFFSCTDINTVLNRSCQTATVASVIAAGWQDSMELTDWVG